MFLEFTFGIKELKKNCKKEVGMKKNRKWIAPYIPVSLSSTDYFNVDDRALNTIMKASKEEK